MGLKFSLRGIMARLVFVGAEAYVIGRMPKPYGQSVLRALKFGYWPFHAFPRTADEKFLWRKVFDRDPLFVRLSDKLDVRNWLAETGIKLEMSPVFWSGHRPEDMPDTFWKAGYILKTNHDSGGFVRIDPDTMDRDGVNAQMNKRLKRDYSRRYGEWGYQDVDRRVFVERDIACPGAPLDDWKCYVCGSNVVRIANVRMVDGKRSARIYHSDGQGGFIPDDTVPGFCGNLLDAEVASDVFERVVALVGQLGASFDHIRPDVMVSGDDIWLGEMTVYNQGGLVEGDGGLRDAPVTRAWDLRRSWFLQTRPGGAFLRLYATWLHRALDQQDNDDGLPPA